jgi:hypothetical protein
MKPGSKRQDTTANPTAPVAVVRTKYLQRHSSLSRAALFLQLAGNNSLSDITLNCTKVDHRLVKSL